MASATKHPCPAELCEREYTLTQTGKIRRHPSRNHPDESCPGSGHAPKGSEQDVADRQDRVTQEWDATLKQGSDDGRPEDVAKARETFERAAEAFDAPDQFSIPHGMTRQEFEDRASRWLSKALAMRREEKGEALTVTEITNLRRYRYKAVIADLKMEAAEAVAPGSDNPMKWPQPNPTPEKDGARGPWFRAGYDGECSECADAFFEGDEIRADGEGGWQGRECCGRDEDERDATPAKPSAAGFMGDPTSVKYEPLPPAPWAAIVTAVTQPLPVPVPTPPWSNPQQSAVPSAADFMDSTPPKPVKAERKPETELGEQITARFKEIFFSYINRDSADNRSAQTHLGPSGIGNPCDRRIALELMRVPACNPGLDGWSSFVGTAVHKALADMFEWANHGTGRFATEVGLEFPVALMPRGTTDLLDRTLLLVLDHKVQGADSAQQLSTEGPHEGYLVQAHTYAYGARLKGEEIEHVAITSWPRDRATLKNLYTWTAPYDESVALKAIARVELIESRVMNLGRSGRFGTEVNVPAKLAIGREFPTADACKFCEFHAPGDKRGERGCQGYDR